MTGEAPIRVLVADEDAATRAGVRLALADHGFLVCAEAAGAASALDAARRERPQLCLIEADLPGGGVSAAQEIAAAVPGTAVVMLSATVDDERLFAALRAGARGYLVKDMDPGRLPSALRGVLDGEAALPRALMGRVVDELRAREHGRHSRQLAKLGVELTHRESQVLDLLDRGLATAEIAQVLGISAVTVRRHVSELVRKLEAEDRESALRAIREAGA